MSTYKKINDSLHYVKIPASDFKIKLWDKAKKTTEISNYCSGGFFGTFTYDGVTFTLPGGNLVADITESSIIQKTRDWMKAWNIWSDGQTKVRKNCTSTPSDSQFYNGKSISTLILNSSNAFSIERVSSVPTSAKYAISGAPAMKNGNDPSWTGDVVPEGWDSGFTYATWHGLLCTTSNTNEVIYVAMKSTTSNLIQTSEAYNKLVSLGLGIKNAIVLDGGGSFVLDNGGTNVAVTSENRRINNLIMY